MRIHVPLTFVAVMALGVLLAGTVLYWYWVPLHRASYVAADRALETSIGLPPGTTRTSETVLPCSTPSDAIGVTPKRTLGYALDTEYLLARPMRAGRVLAFFRRRLAGWTRVDRSIGPPGPWRIYTPHLYRRGPASFFFAPMSTVDGWVTEVDTYAGAHDRGLSCTWP